MSTSHKAPPRLILLAGPSCSGKSTYRAELLSAAPHFAVLSGDDIIEEFCAAEGLSYQQGYAEYRHDVRPELERRLEAAATEGRDIVWDQTNLTREIRIACLDLIPDHYEKVVVGFEAPLSQLLDRAWEREQETGKQVPTEVISAQHGTYQRPHFDEGFDHVFVHDAKRNVMTRLTPAPREKALA